MHGEFSRTPAYLLSNVAREKISILHGQSLRKLDDSCRALGQKEATQSLQGRSPYVLASSSTVVPFDVSRVALAENSESAPYLDELPPSQDDSLLSGDLECMLRRLPQ